MENAAASTGTPSASWLPFDPVSFCLRMSQDSFPATVEEISPSYKRRWPSAGIRTLSGECWTASTSESPNDAVESSLSQVLTIHASDRFFLNPQAAEGLLRRTENRGRKVPEELELAMQRVASGQARDVRRLTPTEYERLQGFPDGWTILAKQAPRKRKTKPSL